MKYSALTLTMLMAVAFWTAGCAKQDNTAIDTSKLERSFANADTDTKQELDRVLASLKSNDFAAAGASLQNLAANLQLTAEQKQAINDTLAQLQSEITRTAEKVRDEAGKAVEELQKALPR